MPVVKIYRDFLTDTESNHLIEVATPLLERSVAGSKNGFTQTAYRTSQV